MAIQTRGKIKRCDHGELESQQQIVFRASGLLDQADSLLGAADLCLRAAGKTAEVRHLLNRVDAVADEADKLLERALVGEGDSARLIEGHSILCRRAMNWGFRRRMRMFGTSSRVLTRGPTRLGSLAMSCLRETSVQP
ncbi:hypothetical protein KME66_33665 [Streptomyces sp. YPW6]|uniref:hypothetical protein n=1 Tax=Streptomyces sp. YPW6 TaxID=2840373 RepID=UPI001C0D1438|nr:hypothetical protein [Streptomyces sp. YPW6]QWQ45378.1 hypothetical protein KME66_33665 [Streptomyces sp. YPW6]